MDTFTTGKIDLSMASPTTGRLLQATVYYVDGVVDANGDPRALSITQLVMALCLYRATELESDIVREMEAMAENTEKLDYYAKIESDMATWYKAHPETTFKPGDVSQSECPNLYSLIKGKDSITWDQFLEEIGEDSTKKEWTYDEFEELMTKVEDTMDTLNTLSQEQLINIQSLTSKRDDTYSLISNVIKSINTVLTGNVNNL